MLSRVRLYTILLSFISLPLLCAQPPGVVIVIHGTWALENSWGKPTGDFFDTLEISAKKSNKKVVPFGWPAKLTHECRFVAAQSLAKLVASYPTNYTIELVCHSHGGNVALLAAQLLALDVHNAHKINTLYCLACPVNRTQYQPNMQIIGHLYNIFSLQDWVQPVLGVFERTFAEHQQVTNIRLMFNDVEPGHTQFQSPTLAKLLLQLPAVVQKKSLQAKKPTNFPGILKLYTHKQPVYALDTDQGKLLEQNKLVLEAALLNATRHIYSN